MGGRVGRIHVRTRQYRTERLRYDIVRFAGDVCSVGTVVKYPGEITPWSFPARRNPNDRYRRIIIAGRRYRRACRCTNI